MFWLLLLWIGCLLVLVVVLAVSFVVGLGMVGLLFVVFVDLMLVCWFGCSVGVVRGWVIGLVLFGMTARLAYRAV